MYFRKDASFPLYYLSGTPPDTHRRLKSYLRFVSGGVKEGLGRDCQVLGQKARQGALLRKAHQGILTRLQRSGRSVDPVVVSVIPQVWKPAPRAPAVVENPWPQGQ